MKAAITRRLAIFLPAAMPAGSHVRKLVMEVFDADTLKSWNTAYIEEFLPRNSTATGFFAFPWDGQTFSPLRELTVPNGNYRVRIKALKSNGNPANAAHWEKWVSPVITIDRPGPK